jgi:hypothetical protein
MRQPYHATVSPYAKMPVSALTVAEGSPRANRSVDRHLHIVPAGAEPQEVGRDLLPPTVTWGLPVLVFWFLLGTASWAIIGLAALAIYRFA